MPWYVWLLIALACLGAVLFLILVIFDFIKEHLKEFKNNFKKNPDKNWEDTVFKENPYARKNRHKYKFHKKEVWIKPEFDKK